MKNFGKMLFKGRKIKQMKEDSAMLGNFIQQVYWGNDLVEKDSKRNLEEGLVEIVCGKDHSSNGLLISDNGYFLTANHCVDHDLNSLGVKTSSGKVYSVEKVCARACKDDVALAKIKIKEDSLHKPYKFFDLNDYENLKKLPLVILSRWEGDLKVSGGFLNHFHCTGGGMTLCGKVISNKHHFQLDLNGIPGDSGGIVTTSRGDLMGFASSVLPGQTITYGVKIFRALELVDFYRNKLDERCRQDYSD